MGLFLNDFYGFLVKNEDFLKKNCLKIKVNFLIYSQKHPSIQQNQITPH